jgi:hypothetical protein
MKHFYYISQGQRLGPASKIDILNLVGKDVLGLNDEIFDVRTSKWFMILAHPDFLKTKAENTAAGVSAGRESTLSISIANPTGITSATSSMTAGKTQATQAIDPKHPQLKWNYKKGATTLGPVSTLGLLMMYRDGSLKDGDIVKSDREPEWKTVKKIFPPELLEQIKMMEPAVDTNKLPLDAVKFEQLLYVGNKTTQHIVFGISITPNTLTFVTSGVAFQENEEVTCLFQSSKGRPMNLSGVIANQSNTPSKFDGFPLIKYVMKFNVQFGLANL